MKSQSKSHRNKSTKAGKLPSQLAQVKLCTVGIDVGSQSHWVSVPETLSPEPAVREFGHFTQDLNSLADWLVQMG